MVLGIVCCTTKRCSNRLEKELKGLTLRTAEQSEQNTESLKDRKDGSNKWIEHVLPRGTNSIGNRWNKRNWASCSCCVGRRRGKCDSHTSEFFQA